MEEEYRSPIPQEWALGYISGLRKAANNMTKGSLIQINLLDKADAIQGFLDEFNEFEESAIDDMFDRISENTIRTNPDWRPIVPE